MYLLRLLAALCVAALGLLPAHAAIEPRQLQVLVGSDAAPPRDDDPRWQPGSTPDSRDAPVAWYRVSFDLAHAAQGEAWVLYLPYLYGGGRAWLNGEPVAAVQENGGRLRVRWERPLLLPLPPSALRDGRNVLLLRAVAAHQPSAVKLPRLALGPQAELQGPFDRRLFFTRTVPLVTVVTGAVVGLYVLWIWLRRRQEVAYGLFGLAALLWALRTTTFVFDALPLEWWLPWRALYHLATGGFIAVLALFAAHLAGLYQRPVALALGAYVLVAPLAVLLGGEAADAAVGRWWVVGLVPVGLSVVVLSAVHAFAARTAGAWLILAAVALAVLAGVHDYAVAWSAPVLERWLPEWSGHRIFLLHHAANVLLMVMGALLTARFVGSLHAVEETNRTLEARVAAREREIAASYEQIAELQREQAMHDERQRIMRDLHDGLGSLLFTSLLRAERGALDGAATAQTLRGAIDEMRVAIEALAGDGHDLGAAFGSFRFRWDARLRDAGLAPRWDLQLPDPSPPLAPHALLQILRIAQEALTNVLKHAHASQVEVRLGVGAGALVLEVRDDGLGRGAGGGPGSGGRGLPNMRARAERLGATLDLRNASPGTCVSLRLPMPAR